jgi:hypothetical protein
MPKPPPSRKPEEPEPIWIEELRVMNDHLGRIGQTLDDIAKLLVKVAQAKR